VFVLNDDPNYTNHIAHASKEQHTSVE